MKLEVLLSVMNIKKEDLDKMNITSDCVVINQSSNNSFEKYKNFKIYSYNEKGISKSRNRALEHAEGDILLFCDDDVIYNKNYEKMILNEFRKNEKADIIFFNLNMTGRYYKKNKKKKRLHFYNCLKYGTFNIAVRKNSIMKKSINFNPLFGSTDYYRSGEDTLFIVDCLKNKLKLYSSDICIGSINHLHSSWFQGYNENYFFDKGALFCAISKPLRYFLCFQYLVRYRFLFKEIKFIDAYKIMMKGAKSYLEKGR